jgi:hypothetical protein
MNKEEAYQSMLQGNKITNRYFTSDEYLQYNVEKDRIETEEGYHMDNYWDIDYLPNVTWEVKE